MFSRSLRVLGTPSSPYSLSRGNYVPIWELISKMPDFRNLIDIKDNKTDGPDMFNKSPDMFNKSLCLCFLCEGEKKYAEDNVKFVEKEARKT